MPGFIKNLLLRKNKNKTTKYSNIKKLKSYKFCKQNMKFI